MSGAELEQERRSLLPEATCLYMSGYPGEVIADHIVLQEGIPLIHKQFSAQELPVTVREVLQSAERGDP